LGSGVLGYIVARFEITFQWFVGAGLLAAGLVVAMETTHERMMPCKQIVVARITALRNEIRERGIATLRQCAEECLVQRSGHSFARLPVQGDFEYCLYCLSFRIRGVMQFDALQASRPPDSSVED